MPRVDEVAAAVRADTAFRDAEVSTAADGEAALVEALVVGDSRDERALAAVERLREDVVPDAFGSSDAVVLVTGETAETIDYRELTSFWLPIVFAFVLGLSFVLLAVAFRSIVMPLVAIALNLLSVSAAYGLLLLVFVEGIGNDLLGFSQVEVIAAWLPLFLFSVLFGLSMDYTVFLLSRIRELHAAAGRLRGTRSRTPSASTARIITGAALIIIMVFVGFANGDQVEFQQMGFGVAISLFIDATLIRLVLLPAVLGAPRRARLVSAVLARVATARRDRGPRRGTCGGGVSGQAPNRSTSRAAYQSSQLSSGLVLAVKALELHERVDEVTAHGARAEECAELGEVEQPVRVPGRPVGVVPVDDPVDDVVRLGGLVEQLGDPGGVLLRHGPSKTRLAPG